MKKVSQKQFNKLIRQHHGFVHALREVEAEISYAVWEFENEMSKILDEVDPNTKDFGFTYTRTADMG